ncbi:SRPBCC family protein [Cryobacterium arcticum]|uniref:SRPBCC family protein n=1 Tax=Cryobacterium arcticum TaxID=670052 RepID=A0A1B1BP78_9MICO|nr:SRPBCC family protein [Cryobacterium arcticum]ANP74311.1 hypothetical protein PA27867_3383 [Cryobacterium arcticum]
MTDYTATIDLPQSLDDSFAFIADPRNLPYYFPRITSAELVGPELVRTTAVIDPNGADDDNGEPVTADAWFRSDPADHVISWGSPENDEYHGRLSAEESDDVTRLNLTLTTSASYPGIQDSLDEALRSIAAKLADS